MKNILFIEDDQVVRENTAELLELSNYKVYTAANGKLGVALALKVIPDLIVCDIMMPELDGYGVLQQLSRERSTCLIPFIFLSAKTEREDIRKGMDMGADDYLTKPFEEVELISAIESRLAKMEILSESLMNKDVDDANGEVSVLKNLDYLKNIFTDNGEEMNLSIGESVYVEGMHSNFVYLMYKGVVKTTRSDEQGKELITGLYKGDDFLGFTTLVQNVPYQETAVVIETAELFRLSKTELNNVLHENHELTFELIDYLAENVADIKQQLLLMAYSSVRKKTAATILQFSQKIKRHPDDVIRISRNDLASVAGIATETFIRALSGLKKEGIIELEGRNIKIINFDELLKVN